MYVCGKNGYLLRNILFAFIVVTFVSLIPVNNAFARTVDLSEWSDGKTANWMNGYIFSPFSYDGEITEYISGADSVTTGRYSNVNGSLILNSQVKGTKHYDKLQVFDIVNNDATSVSLGRRWRIVLLSASGETYGDYFEQVYVTYLDKIFCMFKANLDAGTWEDLNPGQVVLEPLSHTAPWAVVALYDNIDTIRQENGWIINLVSPYYVEDRKSGNFSLDGTQRFTVSPGYASPREYGYSNGYGYQFDSWEEIHIIKVYSEDETFWYRRNQNDPPYSTNTGIDGTFNNQTLGYLGDISSNTEDIATNTYIETQLLSVANQLIQAGNNSLSALQSDVDSIESKVSNIRTTLNSINEKLGNMGFSAQVNDSAYIRPGDAYEEMQDYMDYYMQVKEPFATLNAAYDFVQSTQNFSNAENLVVTIDIPFAGNVSFDLGYLLKVPISGQYNLLYFIRYLTSLPIMIGCLFVSYKLIVSTFGS